MCSNQDISNAVSPQWPPSIDAAEDLSQHLEDCPHSPSPSMATGSFYTDTRSSLSAFPSARSAQHPRLPQEMIDSIIDHHHADPAMLRTCALVSRSWVHASQYHLFYSITIDGPATLDRFIAMISKSRLRSLIRDLRIKGDPNTRRPQNWIRKLLQKQLSNRLPRLHTLRIETIEWSSILGVDKDGFRVFTQFSTVGTLHLFGVEFPDIDTFRRLVLSFPHLSHLFLDTVSWDSCKTHGMLPVANMTPRHVAPDRIEDITLANRRLQLASVVLGRSCDTESLIPWLQRTSLDLCSVELPSVQFEEATLAGRFLKGLGSSLQYLRLGCKFDTAYDMATHIGERIDLTQNSGLRTLNLVVSDLQRHVLPWVSPLLFQIANMNVGRIVIDIWLYDPNQLQTEPWKRIHDHLKTLTRRSVREVIFVHRGLLGEREARRALDGRFPDLVGHALQMQYRPASYVMNWRPKHLR
ncbi:hypothetical protein WOLCODRAFT_18414 [Wolfiporia cocos MD-104 SS10]|uniref:F-box domain-containing protein n=1 Tax=Wolfiporia cocos (strain MD-104) TaxID=742152 RepID=A0A2H3JMZ8_WOLCO|nr:hypothetical protein WOLCODRAFT_18414 [Wolfiporia cocos MD-104 SS10]